MAGGHRHAHGPHHGYHAHGAHGGAHAPAGFGRAFAIGIALNVGFVLIEAGFGIVANSMALLADAGHNLSDVLGLAVAWIAVLLARRPPTERFTYGLGASSILSALFNAVLLLVASGAIAWEAVQRLLAPTPVAGTTMMVVAAIGILVNGLTAWLLAAGRHGDLNVRGAWLHMIADAAVSAGVVVAGLLILVTGWLWLDALAGLLIVGAIVWSTWSLLRDSLAMALAAVPAGIDLASVRQHLAALPGVKHVHDLHVWHMSTTDIALTAHLVMPAGHPGDAFHAAAASGLHSRFGIGHATLQIEVSEEIACPLAPDHVV